MNRTLSGLSTALIGLAVAVSLSASACSLDVTALPPLGEEAGPALLINGPRDGLVYNRADDEDPDAPGIQLVLRVDVDAALADIDDVELTMPDDGLTLRDVVAEDLAGRRAAFFEVTLGDDAHPVVAAAELAAPGDDVERVEARAVLVAAAGAVD